MDAKIHVKRLRIDWDINKKRSAGIGTMLAQCFALITFEIVNETSPNLQGICGNTSRWCLQNYMENGWELTSELASKWITFKITQSNFTLILIITFVILNQTSPYLQDSCRNISWWCLQNYVEIFWELPEISAKNG